MQYVVGVVVFIFGLIIGSFLNVCIYRIPNKKSIISPPSSCCSCNAKIKFYDLIPVFSYLFLRGKCRECGVKISPRYMIIELLTAVLFLVCFLVFGLSGQFLAYIVLTAILITISFIDIEHAIISDSIMIFGLVVGAVFIGLKFIPYPDQTLIESIKAASLGLLCGAGPLIVINIFSLIFIKRPGIGGGDIKLMGVVGLFIGMKNILLALIMGIIIAGIYSVFFLASNKKTSEKKEGERYNMHEMPFGPFLAIGCFVSMICGQQIIDWYLGLFL